MEKVLNYYQNDSLKLEAARFLIRNMPGMAVMKMTVWIVESNDEDRGGTEYRRLSA